MTSLVTTSQAHSYQKTEKADIWTEGEILRFNPDKYTCMIKVPEETTDYFNFSQRMANTENVSGRMFVFQCIFLNQQL